MRKMLSYISALALLFLLSSCDRNKKVVTDTELVLDPDSVGIYIEQALASEMTLLCKTDLDYLDTLTHYYSSKDFQTQWWKAITGDSASWEELKANMLHSRKHGLDERYYYFSRD